MEFREGAGLKNIKGRFMLVVYNMNKLLVYGMLESWGLGCHGVFGTTQPKNEASAARSCLSVPRMVHSVATLFVMLQRPRFRASGKTLGIRP